MFFRMNRRTLEAAKIIFALSGYQSKRIIDIGARDCALKTHFPYEIRYLAVDINQNSDNSIDLVKDISVADISFVSEDDIVVALDVLEHIDDMHGTLKKLLSSKSLTYIFCLPCTSHWLFRIKYLFTGNIPGGKYRLGGSASIKDRHRWVTSYSATVQMMKQFASDFTLNLEILPVNTKFRSSWLSSSFPGLGSWATFYIFSRDHSLN